MKIRYYTNNIIKALLFLSLLLAFSNAQAHSKIDLDDLDGMSNEELELICVERGFELIQDESGEELSHADYVDAARRCLAIEEDMNEILEQNPELADELISEIDRMREEKERLEQERQKMLAEKEKLEQLLLAAAKNKKPTTSAATATDAGSTPRGWGGTTAFSSPQPDQQEQQQQQSASGSGSGTAGDSEGPIVDPASDGTLKALGRVEGTTAFIPHKPASKDEDSSTAIDSTDALHSGNATEESATTAQQDESNSNTTASDGDLDNLCGTPTATTTEATIKNETSDFSLKGFIQEIMTEFEKDVHRVTSLLLPVIKPLFSAGNAAWKYMKIVVKKVKRQLENYRQSTKPADDSSGVKRDSSAGSAASSSK